MKAYRQVSLSFFIKKKRGGGTWKCVRFFPKDVDEASLTRVQLERKVESLLDEINFLKKTHDEVGRRRERS